MRVKLGSMPCADAADLSAVPGAVTYLTRASEYFRSVSSTLFNVTHVLEIGCSSFDMASYNNYAAFQSSGWLAQFFCGIFPVDNGGFVPTPTSIAPIRSICPESCKCKNQEAYTQGECPS